MKHPSLRIHRMPDRVERLLRRARPIPLLHRTLALGLAGLMWPDAYARWARRVFESAAFQGQCDRTLAFVLPASVLLSGRYPRVVDRTWAFDYQESVTPQFRQAQRRSPIQKRLLPKLEALERETLHQAGRVIFTADTNRKAYVNANLVSEEKTVHVPYFYDEAAFAEPAPPPDKLFEIVYFGGFDWRGARTPESFLRAMASFLEKTPEARSKTRFTFYGSWLAEHNRFLDEFKLGDVVGIRAALGYQEYLQKLRECPVLLLVVSSAHNLFMPSKIVDYFGSGRPIMAFVPRQSEMREVLARADMLDYVADEADVTEGATILQRLWQKYLTGTLGCGTAKSRYWSSTNQIPRYIELMTTVPGTEI